MPSPTPIKPPFSLRIRFSGLCAFVFQDLLKVKPIPGKTPAPLTEAVVLLKNLLTSRPLSPRTDLAEPQAQFLDPHYPQLEFKLANLHPSNRRQPDLKSNLKQTNDTAVIERGLCLLQGRELEVRPDGQQPPQVPSLTVPRDEPKNKLSPQGADAETLWWMATVEDAFPGRGRIRSGLLKERPNEGGEIVARLGLAQGRLFSSVLSDRRCTFEPPGSESFDQRIATEITWEISGLTDRVEIAFRRRGAAEESLILHSTDGSPVEVELKNAEIDEFLGLEPYVLGSNRPEADFEIYHQMIDGLDERQRRVVPRQQNETGLGVLIDTRHGGLCPPSAFSA